MSESEVLNPLTETAETVVATATLEEVPRTRKRPKPGERREQILQALAAMLEKPGSDRITTAALAANLSVSEAALYRHFASKAQMFEGLIDFIEQSVFSLVQQVMGRDGEVLEFTPKTAHAAPHASWPWCCSSQSATPAWCVCWWAMLCCWSMSACRCA